MLPSLESLRCFVEAARLLSFRKAARAAGLTPAALGQRIRQLEEQLGEPLFHRTTRRVLLTEAGARLVPQARRVLEEAAACLSVAAGSVDPPPSEIVLGTRHELGLSWIVPLLPRLRAARKGLTVNLYFGSGSDLLLRLRTAEIDCAVTSSRLTDPALEGLRLHREDYVFVGARRLLAARPLDSAAAAGQHALIDTDEQLALFRYWRDAPGGLDSLRFARVLRMGTIAAIRQLVLRGEGVAVLPRYYVAQDLAARRLTRVLPAVEPLHDFFRLVFRSDDPRRPLYELLATTMQQAPLR